MNLNNINSFIRVAEAGSFNKAAEELHLTSTALIKQINLLEQKTTLASKSPTSTCTMSAYSTAVSRAGMFWCRSKAGASSTH